MEIIVQGKAEKFYIPDEVLINLEFYTNEKTYEEALSKGSRNVELFIKEVLEVMNIKKESLKTNSFRIYEEKKFDYNKQEEIKLGFAYKQNASLKFDYDIKKISEFMDRTSKMSTYPKYTISFNLKNEEEFKAETIKLAYEDAKKKANKIASASGKELKDCLKTSFKPFEEAVQSNSVLEGDNLMYKTSKINEMSVQDVIQNIFVPEDVSIQETLYCLWLAE